MEDCGSTFTAATSIHTFNIKHYVHYIIFFKAYNQDLSKFLTG